LKNYRILQNRLPSNLKQQIICEKEIM